MNMEFPNTLSTTIMSFLALHILHRLTGKQFREEEKPLSYPCELQYLNPEQAARRGLLLAGVQSGKPSECNSRRLPEQTCSYAVITVIFTNGGRAIAGEKCNKPQLPNQCAGKIHVLVEDPSATS